MGAAVIFLTSYPSTVWTHVSCQAISPMNGLGTRLYSSQPEPLPWTASCLISELRPSANSVNFHPVLQQLNSCHLTYYNQHAVWKLFDQKEKSDYSYPFYFCSQTQHTRRIFEDLIAKQTQEALRDSPVVRRQRRTSIKKPHLNKEKPPSKPDSVFQKLIDRFDPMRLTSGAKTRVKSWYSCQANWLHICNIVQIFITVLYLCELFLIFTHAQTGTICDVILGAGYGRYKPRLVVRSWTHPIRSEAVKYCLWALARSLACAVCTCLADVGIERIWRARS